MFLLIRGVTYECTPVMDKVKDVLLCQCPIDIQLEDIDGIFFTGDERGDKVFVRVSGNDTCLILGSTGHGLFMGTQGNLQVFAYCDGTKPQAMPTELQSGIGTKAWELISFIAVDNENSSHDIFTWTMNLAASQWCFIRTSDRHIFDQQFSRNVLNHLQKEELIRCFKLWFNVVDDVTVEDAHMAYLQQAKENKIVYSKEDVLATFNMFGNFTKVK